MGLRINMFITIQYLNHFDLIPFNLCVSSCASPHSSFRSSYLRYISPESVQLLFFAFFQPYLFCPCNIEYGIKSCLQSSNGGLTIAFHRGTINPFSLIYRYVRFDNNRSSESFQEPGYHEKQHLYTVLEVPC